MMSIERRCSIAVVHVDVHVAIIRDLTSSHFEYASTIRNNFHRDEQVNNQMRGDFYLIKLILLLCTPRPISLRGASTLEIDLP